MLENGYLKTKEERIHFDLFDLIRFCACLMVVFYHYDGLCNYQLGIDQSATFDWIIRNGGEAIVLFFMLSGFCMAHGYRDRIAIRGISAGDYAWKHYKKFLMMNLITLPVTILKAFYMYRAGLDTVPNLYGFLLDILGIRTGYGLSGSFGYNGPMWFINVLFLVYMIYYLVCSLCRTKEAYLVTSLLLVLFSMSELAGQMLSFFILNKDTYIGVMGFFIGVLLYEEYEQMQYEKYIFDRKRGCRKVNRLCLASLIIAAFACYMNTHWPGIGVLPEGENLWVNTKLVLTILVWAPLVFLSAQVHLDRKRVITKGIGWLGKLASSVYIWHWPVLYLYYCWNRLGIVRWNLTSGRGFLIVWGITFLFSLFSMSFLEKDIGNRRQNRQRMLIY